MIRLALLAATLVLALAAGITAVRAENLMDRIIVFDLSQSMWAPVGGEHRRYEIARLAGEQLVRKTAALQPQVSLGLIAFGHQFVPGADRCDDIAVLAPPTSLASPSAVERLAAITRNLPPPRGKTPLTEAIQAAARSLSDGGVLIIISDFRETCDDLVPRHPCDAFVALQRSGELDGIEIRYIVAIADPGDEIGRMNEFAQCTGAKLLPVNSPASAADMATAIVMDLQRASEPLELRVRFKLDRGTDLPPNWGSPPLDGSVSVTGPGGDASAVIDAPVKTFPLVGGAYRITAMLGGQRWTADAVLEAARDTFDIAIPAARVALSVTGPEGEAVTDGAWTVTGRDGAATSRQGAAAGFDLPPGSYRIEVRSRLGGAALDLDLEPGDDIRREVRLDAALGISAKASISLSAAIDAPSLFADRAAAPPELLLKAATGQIVRIGMGAAATEIEAGRYDAVIAWSGAGWPIAPVELAAGKAMAVSVTIAPGAIDATFEGAAGDRVRWRIGGSEGGQVEMRGARLSQSLPPGTYLVTAELDGETRQRTVTVGIADVQRFVLGPDAQ